MRLTIRTNIAMRALMFCALNPGRLVRRSEIAARCNASPNHLAQVVHVMAQRGFLATMRGRGGGIRLGRPAEEISVGSVFRSLEGEVPFIECFEGGENDCPMTGACRLGHAIGGAVEAFYAYLDAITLADLVVGNKALAQQICREEDPARPRLRAV